MKGSLGIRIAFFCMRREMSAVAKAERVEYDRILPARVKETHRSLRCTGEWLSIAECNPQLDLLYVEPVRPYT